MTNQIGNSHDAGIDSEIGTLTIEELEAAGGGMDNNYKECVLGTTAGGPPGLYPWYAVCRMK